MKRINAAPVLILILCILTGCQAGSGTAGADEAAKNEEVNLTIFAAASLT